MKTKRKPAKKSVRKSPRKSALRQTVEAIVTEVREMFSTTPKDLISAIKKDHEALRRFIGVLKDTKRDMKERRRAAELFSSLLKSHTIAEETAVYKQMEKRAKHDLIIRIEEGYVEHHVADTVLAEMEKAQDTNVWSAHANVLAELVEHHLDEEEEELFPLMKKQLPKTVEPELRMQFLELRAGTQKKVADKNAGILDVLRN